MRLTKRPNLAINQIIQEEVQSVIRGRRRSPSIKARSLIIENLDERDFYEMLIKLDEVIELLSMVAPVLKGTQDEALAVAAEKSVNDLYWAIGKHLDGDGDDDDDDDDGEVDLPPMHPRSRR